MFDPHAPPVGRQRGTVAADRHGLAPALLLAVLWLAPCGAGAAAAEAPANDLGEIIVTATLRPTRAQDLPVSVSVLDASVLHDAGQQSIQDVLGLIPNLNWAGDTSRPRYFQLRGIGELEQYQGAPNSSVGFLIDGIDFSGLGTAATLFDVDRIEVLRGPQATRYGANALGGLINVESAAPAAEYGARAQLGAGDYAMRSYAAVVTGPVPELDSSFRLGVQHYYTDGYYHDLYLNRWDTNRRDELTLRGRWRYVPSEDLSLDLTLLHVQIDNGYDAFAIDNSRNTQSDNPGIDAQHSTGVSLRANYRIAPELSLTANGAYAKSLVKYGYDGDWGNPLLWAPYLYNYTELQYRDRQTRTLELRLASQHAVGRNWLVGAYVNDLTESLLDTNLGLYGGPGLVTSLTNTVIDSGYRARNLALFGELDGDFTSHLHWSLGARGEQRTASYAGTTTDYVAGATYPASFEPIDHLWGGSAALNYALDRDHSFYLQLARGYKAGGFNLSQGLLASQLQFAPEWDVNLEAGYKGALLGRSLTLAADLFYLYRRDAQIKTSYQSDPHDPNTFVQYTGNAKSGHNYGLESELNWHIRGPWSVSSSLGLLQTQFENFSQLGTTLASESRELANAPHWQAAVSAIYRDAHGDFARIDATGMGSYYFDLPPNETRSSPYGLLNGKFGVAGTRWTADFYVRNALDKRYPVRGFYFGDVPPNFNNELYIQLGEPRTVGVELSAAIGGLSP